MKESLRRVILFTVIVITGSVMILFDVPLILMIPLILAVGFVILLLLGAITVSDIRSVFIKLNIQNLKKSGIIKRLDGMKFFEKQPLQPGNKSVSPGKKENPKKTGTVSHLRSFLSSLGSLGTILKQRSKPERKVEQINQLLDKAVSEKVKSSALASAGNVANAKTPAPQEGGGPGTQKQVNDQDPFLSLSMDEFDVSLLDGLEDQPTPQSKSSHKQEPSMTGNGSGMAMADPDIPMPSLDINSEADDILKGNPENLEEFKGLEGGESIDKDFGDLDSLNLEDVDLDFDLEDESPAAVGDSTSKAESAGSSSSPNPSTSVNTDWIASDAPKNADITEDKISTQADMASFAGGASGTDEDLLSSLASDVKHVTKEKNTSLLRDLKDFKAPATDIENELKDMYETMKAIPSSGKKVAVPAKKMK